MPVPRRKAGEDYEKYRKRLVEFFVNEGKNPKQAAAIAYSMVRKNKSNRKGCKCKK